MRIYKTPIKKYKITQPGFTYLIKSKLTGIRNIFTDWKIEKAIDGSYVEACAVLQILLDDDKGKQSNAGLMRMAEKFL